MMNRSFIIYYLLTVIKGSPCVMVAFVGNVDNFPFEFMGQIAYVAKATDAQFNHARAFLVTYYWSIRRDSQTGKWVATWLIGFIVAGFIPNTLFNFVWFWFIHYFVFVWFEYQASSRESDGSQIDLDFGLKGQLNCLSDWLERKLVKNISE